MARAAYATPSSARGSSPQLSRNREALDGRGARSEKEAEKKRGKTRVVQGSTRSQVVVTEPVHRVGGQWESGHDALVRSRLATQIGHGIEQHLRPHDASPRQQSLRVRQDCGQVAAGAVARQAQPRNIHVQARGMIDQPAQRGGAIVQRCWKRMLGRQAIVDGVHRGSAFLASVRQMASCVSRLPITQPPPCMNSTAGGLPDASRRYSRTRRVAPGTGTS